MREQEDPGVFLASQGWKFRMVGNQYEGTCPLCGKEKHLYVNKFNGLWDCKRCGEAGNLYQLKAKLGLNSFRTVGSSALKPSSKKSISLERVEKAHTELMLDAEAMAYLTSHRCYETAAIKESKLMLETWRGARWVGFPWWKGGACVGIKFRLLPADAEKDASLPRFRREPGFESILYNVDALKDGKTVILASGETDALAFLSMGFKSVVATTTGETAMPESAIAQLKEKDRIYIAYDNDEAGFSSAKRIARRIGLDRCFIVRLPDGVKDANQFLELRAGQAKADMEELIKAAFRLNIPSVYEASEVVDKLKEGFLGRTAETKKVTPWYAVNKIVPDFNGLVVVSAPQGTGKTTWGLNVADYWAWQRKPALFYCLEMTAEELITKVLMARYDKSLEQVRADDDGILGLAGIEYYDVPLYLGASFRLREPKEVAELLRMAIIRYQLQMVIFDNVHVIGRKQDRRAEIGQFTLALKDLSLEMEVPILAIAQPRKLEPGQIMSPWDLKDSVDLFSDADQILILHRQQLAAEKDTEVFSAGPPETLYSPFTLVRVAKSRFAGPRDSVIYLEGRHHKFRDLESGEMVEFKGGKGKRKRAPWEQ